MALVVKQQQKESENNYSISSSKGSAVKTSKKKNKRSMSVPGIGSLAFIESLSMPLVQEVVISADVQCAECQKRVADVISRMSGEFFLDYCYIFTVEQPSARNNSVQ
ncbi:hypothetical protein LINGRAHAP2_LOCUS9595 [Linum grandiflorum]